MVNEHRLINDDLDEVKSSIKCYVYGQKISCLKQSSDSENLVDQGRTGALIMQIGLEDYKWIGKQYLK